MSRRRPGLIFLCCLINCIYCKEFYDGRDCWKYSVVTNLRLNIKEIGSEDIQQSICLI